MTGSMGFATKQALLEKAAELQYASAFRAAYPAEPSPNPKNYGRAIAAYEATLTTPRRSTASWRRATAR
jgi:cytochrome c peroxidase